MAAGWHRHPIAIHIGIGFVDDPAFFEKRGIEHDGLVFVMVEDFVIDGRPWRSSRNHSVAFDAPTTRAAPVPVSGIAPGTAVECGVGNLPGDTADFISRCGIIYLAIIARPQMVVRIAAPAIVIVGGVAGEIV